MRRQSFVSLNTKNFEDEYDVGRMSRGKLGTTFKVSHKVSQARRVCKRVPKEVADASGEESVAELDMLRRLDHPNILRLFEWFDTDDSVLLIMDWARGGDLGRLLSSVRAKSSRPGLAEPLVRKLMLQALQALAFIHARRIVHCDVKPANLLLASGNLESPRLLLADFGIAERFEGAGGTQPLSCFKGTLQYCAPEMLANAFGPCSDVWSLGVMTFELMSGERPFASGSLAAAVQSPRTGKLSVAPLRDAGASDEAGACVARLLSKDESSRPSAKEAMGDPWFLSASPTSAPPGHPPPLRPAAADARAGSGALFRLGSHCAAAQLDLESTEQHAQTFAALDRKSCTRKASLDHSATGSLPPLSARGRTGAVGEAARDEAVCYTEFVASRLLSEEWWDNGVVHHVFAFFDADGDGLISQRDLQHVESLVGGPCAGVAEEASAELGAGPISLTAFQDRMRRAARCSRGGPAAGPRPATGSAGANAPDRAATPCSPRRQQGPRAEAGARSWLESYSCLVMPPAGPRASEWLMARLDARRDSLPPHLGSHLPPRARLAGSSYSCQLRAPPRSATIPGRIL